MVRQGCQKVPTEDGTEQVVTLRVSVNNIAGAAFESF